MKKYIPCFLAILLFSCVNSSDSDNPFEGGTGTEENPFQISTIEQLQQIGQEENLDKHFIQVNDIDASASADLNEGDGFLPIGTQTAPFTGSYDGNGLTISELTIDVFHKHSGLFGYVKDGLIENMNLVNSGDTSCTLEKMKSVQKKNFDQAAVDDDIIIIEDIYAGGWLLGYNDDGTIRNSSVTGYYNNRYTYVNHVGGLVGFNSGDIENSTTNAQIIGRGNVGGLAGGNVGEITNSHTTGCTGTGSGRAGGLVGYNGGSEGSISNSSASGIVLGAYGAGGLAAMHFGAKIETSYSSGQVIDFGDAAGGFVGINMAYITNSYSLSGVDENGVDGYMGGFAGINREDGYITESYSTGGAISTNEDVTAGGFAGLNYGRILSVFWDSEASGLMNETGEGSNEGITSLTTDQMTGPEAESSMGNFNWGTTWKTTSGYPILMWQEEGD